MKAVILAGGTGTRLWPLSRDSKPKQFHAFFGNKTMLQQTYERLLTLVPHIDKKDIFVATNSQYATLVASQLPSLKKNQIIIEPAMRDTGPCICHAANFLAKLGAKDETMLIIYADHLIQKPNEFKKAILMMNEDIERTGALGVVAVPAKYANPNLGYIKIGKPVKTKNSSCKIYELDQFVEKPNEKTAKKFLKTGKFLWNTGLYMWKIETILEKFKTHAPEIYKAIVLDNDYKSAPKISIDYAVMEKLPKHNVHVLAADPGWNDIGNWAALHEELAKNSNANIYNNEKQISLDTEGCVIFGENKKIIVTYGVKNLVIVETPDALLILDKSKAAEMKKVIEELQKRGREKLL